MKKTILSRPSIIIGVIAGFSVLLIFGLFWWGIDHWISDPNIRGVFGDKFGAVNALFSGLAFLGLIITLVFQQEELKLQRSELEQTREELSSQRKEFEIQNKTLKYQQFESTLYSMMSLQQQIVSDLYYDSSVEKYSRQVFGSQAQTNVVVKGRDLFRFSFVKQKFHYRYQDDTNVNTVDGFRKCLHDCGLGFYLKREASSYYDHYFRHLYRIIKFIDSSDALTVEEKYQTIGNVRGTMSRYELVWLYYNILANRFVKFKSLVEKYAFLKNIDPSALALCKENIVYVEQFGEKALRDKGFESTDYYFFMTDRKDDEGKYYIGAFYNEANAAEYQLGKNRLEEWRKLIVVDS